MDIIMYVRIYNSPLTAVPIDWIKYLFIATEALLS